VTEKAIIQPDHVAKAFRRVQTALAVHFPYPDGLSEDEIGALATSRLTDPTTPEVVAAIRSAARLDDDALATFLAECAEMLDDLEALAAEVEVDDERAWREAAAWLGLVVGATSAMLATEQGIV
jgi:hypothetical protein